MPKRQEGTPVYFFVEFLPGGLHALAGLPAHTSQNMRLPMELVFPQIYSRMFDALMDGTGVEETLNVVDAILLELQQRQITDSKNVAGEILKKKQLIYENSVEELSKHLGFSERQLHRLFREGLGVPPKSCARVLRVNAAAQLLYPGVHLTRLAHRLGYYDQAHFIHDFKKVCGVTPGEYLRAMSDFYKEEYKFPVTI